MKSAFYVLCLLMCAGRVAHAQAPIALGITSGVNISTEDFNISGDTARETRTGLILTGQTDWPLFGAAVLQDRLSYIEKGVSARRATILGGVQTINTELRYIELSLAPKIKLGMHDFKPYLFIGPRLGLLVSGDRSTQSGNTTTSEDIRTNYNSLDFGIDIGAGFSLPVIPKLYFTADGGYSFGLSNILKRPVTESDRAFSRDLKIQAGFLLEVYNVTHSSDQSR